MAPRRLSKNACRTSARADVRVEHISIVYNQTNNPERKNANVKYSAEKHEPVLAPRRIVIIGIISFLFFYIFKVASKMAAVDSERYQCFALSDNIKLPGVYRFGRRVYVVSAKLLEHK